MHKNEKVVNVTDLNTSMAKMINSMFYILYYNKKMQKSQWLATMCVMRIFSKISEVLPWISVGSKFKILLLETMLLGFTQFYLMKQETQTHSLKITFKTACQ